MLYCDKNGNIFPEPIEGVTAPLDITLDEPVEGFVGEIWYDEAMRCMVDDRERAYWYKYEDGKAVKYDWKKRFEAGEFTLEDFKAKVLYKVKNDYRRATFPTDSDVLMYEKRKTLGLLEPGDEERRNEALEKYKALTLTYRDKRDAINASASIDALIEKFTS